VNDLRRLLITQDDDPTVLNMASTMRDDGDEVGVVLLMDSSYMATRSGAHSGRVIKAMNRGIVIFLLERDVERRGIGSLLLQDISIIGYADLVDLLFIDDQRVYNL
jgi:sulfur relay protein TusB/DsrH